MVCGFAHRRRWRLRISRSEKCVRSRIVYGTCPVGVKSQCPSSTSPPGQCQFPYPRDSARKLASAGPFRGDRCAIRDIRRSSYLYDTGGANQDGGPTAPRRLRRGGGSPVVGPAQ